MKKLSLGVALVAFLMSSCCGNSEKKECCNKGEMKECCKKSCEGMSEEQKQARAEFKAKWADFENQTADVQKELIAKKKEFIDSKREALKAKIAECEKKFEGFDTLTIAQQKALLDELPCCKEQKC